MSSPWLNRLDALVAEAGLRAEEGEAGRPRRVGRPSGLWLLIGAESGASPKVALSFELAHPAVRLLPSEPVASAPAEGRSEVRAEIDFSQAEGLVEEALRAALQHIAAAAAVLERPSPTPSLARRGSELLAEIEGARRSTKTLPGPPPPKAAAPTSAPRAARAPDGDLIDAAHAARKHAFAPYSHYAVGAALRTADGRIFAGANVENASYGLSVCAERSAVVAAVSAGVRHIVAVAVVTASSPPAAPCGVCRQTLAEFGADDLEITLANDRGEVFRTTLGELLPRAFRGDALS